jgi:hypothetical protein
MTWWLHSGMPIDYQTEDFGQLAAGVDAVSDWRP